MSGADVSTWRFVVRDYDAERDSLRLGRQSSSEDHPLQRAAAVVEVKKADAKTADAVDPLMMADPLSALLGAATARDDPLVAHSKAPEARPVERPSRWAVKARDIMRDFSNGGTVRLSTALLKDDSVTTGWGRKKDAEFGEEPSSLADRSAARLQQLEAKKQPASRSAPGVLTEVTEKECADHIERLKKQLLSAWAADERVHALKLAEKCAQLLGETGPFYPALFVLATGVLETFGDLVYERISHKAATGDDAEETCRNWFYKTACIRELLPRFYVEVALLRCYGFLAGDFRAIVARMASMTRGIGDPLTAVYARCYLQISSHAPLAKMVRDHLFCFQELRQEKFTKKLQELKMSECEYIRLCEPALEFLLLEGVDDFEAVIECYRDYCNDATVLRRILEAFDASRLAENPLYVVQLAKAAEPSTRCSTVDLMAILGARFAERKPAEKIKVLNEVWRVVTRCDNLPAYLRCCASWLGCLLRFYSKREVKVLLSDLVRHLDDSTVDDASRALLEEVVQLLLDSKTEVLASGQLLRLMDVFSVQRKVAIAKEVLASTSALRDTALVQTLLEVARFAHDALDSFSPEGERRHVSSLICGFVQSIDLDAEAQLSAYVDCRAAFADLDAVLERLVLLAIRLAKRSGSRDFAKACLAYAHVTIPSVDILRRPNLLVYCGQTALAYGCLPQAETFFKAAVTLITEVPSGEVRVLGMVRYLLSAIVVLPPHPDHQLYLLKGLLNAVSKLSDAGARAAAQMAAIPFMAALSQAQRPYTVPGVLYEAGEEQQEPQKRLALAVEAVVADLALLGGERRAELALDFVNVLLVVDLRRGDAATFLRRLLALAAKQREATPFLQNYFDSTRAAFLQATS